MTNLCNLRIILLSLFLSTLTNSQIVFRDFPDNQSESILGEYSNIKSNSEINLLSGSWEVYPIDNPNKKFFINVPSLFEGEGVFVYTKKFKLTEEQIKDKKISLHFLGLNYSADIRVNNALIYRHTGGDIPFSLSLPRDILHSNKDNILKVILTYELNSDASIPLNKRFFFPKSYGGIYRDVFLKISPAINIQSVDVNSSIDFTMNRAKLELITAVENKQYSSKLDKLPLEENITLDIEIISPDGKSIAKDRKEFILKRNQEFNINSVIYINSPILWSIENPTQYLIKAKLLKDNKIISYKEYDYSIFDIKVQKDNISLNNKPFNFYGVTYIPTYFNYGPLISQEQMVRDIEKIKQSGFNSVRFIKSIPHPYLLKLCQTYGLLPIIDLPISELPEGLAGSTNFKSHVKNYLELLLKSFKEYSTFSILNLGSSYLSYSEDHRLFLNEISRFVKRKKNILVGVSFFDKNFREIEGIDLYGIELINESVFNISEKIENLKNYLGKGRIYISEATYTVNTEHSDGYLNKYSPEAQAKFFEDLIKYSDNNNFAGYFINSIFDYSGDFASIFFKPEKQYLYKLGLISEDRKNQRLAYKVVTSYLKDTERVTIPIGTKKDDSPLIFILLSIFSALLMAILINSSRKFREDASRALLRTYNFYADIRDQRIISVYKSLFLIFIIALTGALIASNLIYYFRSNLFLEKILLSFGSKSIIYAFSFLAWDPFNSVIWLFLACLVFLLLLMIIIKLASYFVRNKVYTSSIFFLVVWSLIPIVLFIPLGIILYRLLNAEIFNTYIFVLLILIKIYLILRIIKGIYIIFDVKPSEAYLYSFLFILIVITGLVSYFEINYSLIDNILLVFKQFRTL